MSDPEMLTHKLERVMRLYHAIARSQALRPAQWQALRFFAQAPAAQRTVSGLAHARASTMGTTSITVSSLVERGLVERGSEGRNVGLRVTEAGHTQLRTRDPAHKLTAAVSRLPHADLQTLDRALAQLITALEPDLAAMREPRGPTTDPTIATPGAAARSPSRPG